MQFKDTLISGTIVRRYKRFLCDILLDSGEQIVAHCPNSGSMKGIVLSDCPAMVSYNPSPSRKYQYTLEMVRNGSVWIGINTMQPNRLVEEGIVSGTISELNPYVAIKREVVCSGKSRLDFRVEQADATCFIEVKNVTLAVNRKALFPDSVTKRGQKHLSELIHLKKSGYRAMMLYIVQRLDCVEMGPAWDIDSEYSEKLVEAVEKGVEAYAYLVDVSPQELALKHKIPVMLP